MDQYILLLTIAGFAAFFMAWMPAFTRSTGISYSILYVLAGILLYVSFPGILPEPLPMKHEMATLRIAEMVVIISLMGTGIKIDRPFSWKNWASPLRLISIAMLLCIGGAALAGYFILELNPATAILLGAALAPTDPVLASDVQVGPPNVGRKSETRFSLTAEAGLNDGMSFPFTWLAIALAGSSLTTSATLLNWFAYDLLYKIGIGMAIGIGMGKLAGYVVFTLSMKNKSIRATDGFLALALTLLVYGITEMLHGYGFVAVFVCAVVFRHYEKDHEYHDHLHAFTDQAERLLVGVILLLFGGALVSGILNALTWKLVFFSLLFLFVIRPLAAYVSLAGIKMDIRERVAISFFGIRGIGSIFYLAFALHTADFMEEAALWSVVAFTILVSIFIHGLTANTVMRRLKNKIAHEEVPK